jgi:hypothetical protein
MRFCAMAHIGILDHGRWTLLKKYNVVYSTNRTQPNRKRTQSGPSAFALGSLGRTQSEHRANP